MTGEEFLNKVRAMKNITDIHWQVTGEDVLDPAWVQVAVIADGEEIKVSCPFPNDSADYKLIQNTAIGLVLNKFLEQVGNDLRVCNGDDMVRSINYSRKQLVK